MLVVIVVVGEVRHSPLEWKVEKEDWSCRSNPPAWISCCAIGKSCRTWVGI